MGTEKWFRLLSTDDDKNTHKKQTKIEDERKTLKIVDKKACMNYVVKSENKCSMKTKTSKTQSWIRQLADDS